MTPRLAVSRDDADWLIDHRNNDADTYVVRLPERPTMPCPERDDNYRLVPKS